MPKFTDDELGMTRAITQRDLLNGMVVSAGAAALSAIPGGTAHAGTGGGAGYPPSSNGIVGQTDAARTVGHGATFGDTDYGPPRDLGEHYDLVIVGGGVSGLAAAHFYQQTFGRRSRILILEALADFGGHQHRNEFRVRGRTLLSNGGMVNLDSPDTWNPPSLGLLQDLGIDLPKLAEGSDTGYYTSKGLGTGYFFPKESFGADKLVTRGATEPLEPLIRRLPLSKTAQDDILKVENTTEDYFPGLSDAGKKQRLARISYADYLRQHVGIGEEALVFYQRRTHGLWGTGIEAVPAGDCWGTGLPGFTGLALTPAPYNGIGRTPAMSLTAKDEELYYFPDGGATVSRLLVSRLVPGVFPGGQTMESIITARADYGALDNDRNRVRIRLNAMATDVRHQRGVQGPVDVSYVSNGKPYRVSASHVVMACWNAVASYIVPGLPAAQVEAMRYGVKVPLVYARVALRDWRAWERAGISRVTPYNTFWDSLSLFARDDVTEEDIVRAIAAVWTIWWRSCRAASTPPSALRGINCPAASVNVWRWPGHCLPGGRC